jgi:N utilization substance protein A
MKKEENNKALKDGYRSLLDLQGIGEKRATDLYEADFKSAGDVARATVEDLLSVKGMSESKAEELIEEAIRYTDKQSEKDTLQKDAPEEQKMEVSSADEGSEATGEDASEDEEAETGSGEKSEIVDQLGQDVNETEGEDLSDYEESETDKVEESETEDPPKQNNNGIGSVKVSDE